MPSPEAKITNCPPSADGRVLQFRLRQQLQGSAATREEQVHVLCVELAALLATYEPLYRLNVITAACDTIEDASEEMGDLLDEEITMRN
jgi:hypothetical protein